MQDVRSPYHVRVAAFTSLQVTPGSLSSTGFKHAAAQRAAWVTFDYMAAGSDATHRLESALHFRLRNPHLQPSASEHLQLVQYGRLELVIMILQGPLHNYCLSRASRYA